MWMNYEGYGMGGYWLGCLGMALFWLVPLLLVLAAIKYLISGRRTNVSGDESKHETLKILAARYTRGEIDRAEYLQKRDDLASK